jgi:rhodanese-related sulfurtransferase
MITAEIIKASEIGTLTVIDLRDAEELHRSGHASGALHIPLAELARRANPDSPDFDMRISQGKPVAVYSAAGGRSAKAREILSAMGYQVLDIGGFYHWAVAGGPISR